MSKLKGLKKVQETVDQPEQETTEQVSKPSLSKLKSLKQDTQTTEKSESKGSVKTSTFDYDAYVKLLGDGEFHKIRDVLDHFQLPHTSGGREKLRRSNATIVEKSNGTLIVESAMVDGAKAFRIVEVAKK